MRAPSPNSWGKILSSTDSCPPLSQLSRPISSGHHIYMELGLPRILKQDIHSNILDSTNCQPRFLYTAWGAKFSEPSFRKQLLGAKLVAPNGYIPNCQIVLGSVLRKCAFQGRSRNHGNRALGPGRPELSILNRKCNKEMCVSEEVPRSWKLGPGPRTSQSVRF